jgi:hypothetical protein
MKIIKYKFLSCEVNQGTEEAPNLKQILLEKAMSYSEANEEIAKKEAYNGKYTIEEVEDTEPVEQSLEERTAALEEALTLLLEGATE